MQKSFKAYMRETYTHNELADIAQHGCVSGCAATMIYYSDTEKLFSEYHDDLFEIIAEYQESIGEQGLGDYINKNCDTFRTFANSVVWSAAEIIAWNITQGEYIDEENAA